MIDLCRLKFEIQPASLNKLQSPIKQRIMDGNSLHV